MTILRAQVVHKHRSGLPRDNVVNTFHFSTAAYTEASAETLAERVRDMYTTVVGANATALQSWFADSIALVGHEVRVYPIDEDTGLDERGPGQPPVWIETFDHIGRNLVAGMSLPAEVALCLSYKNSTPSGVPPAQRRGRVYFGPFVEKGDVLAEDATLHIGRPSALLQTELLECGKWLKNHANDATNVWGVFSRPFEGRPEITAQARKDAGGPFRALPALPARGGAFYDITDLWVDDAWDTVRRRGERAASRQSAVV